MSAARTVPYYVLATPEPGADILLCAEFTPSVSRSPLGPPGHHWDRQSPGHPWDLSGRSRVHLHCSFPPAGCLSGPGRVSAEEGRLAAEEGSYSLKTWLRKTSRGWVSSSTGPQSRPVSTVLLSYLSLPPLDGHGWSRMRHAPQSQPSILPFLVGDRRLAEEEGLFSPKTWLRKTRGGR